MKGIITMNNFAVHTLLNNLKLYSRKGEIMVSSDPTEDTYSYPSTRFAIAPNDTLVIEFSESNIFRNRSIKYPCFLQNHSVK